MRRVVQATFIMLVLLFRVSAGSAAPTAPLDPKLCEVPSANPGASADKKNKRKARAAIEVARGAYLKGDFAASITALQEAYALDPVVELLYNIAQACREAGLHREALPLYEAVLKQNPSQEEKEASEAKVTELRPKVAEFESAQATKALDDKQFTEASEGYKRAYKFNPLPIYLFQLAQTQRLAGRSDEAIASYEQFLARKPTGDPARDAQKYLGRLRAHKEDEKATAHYEKGEYIQAILVWDGAYKLDARAIYIFRKAEAMYKARQFEEAMREYQHFLNQSPPQDQRELRQQAEARIAELKVGGPAQPPVSVEKKPVYKRWWFWVAIGGGAVAAVALGVAIGRGPADPLAAVPMQNVRPITP